jgi:hypothetical protein
MVMCKTVSPAGWEAFDWPAAQLIKIAHDGLRGHDLGAFVKRASGSEHVFLPLLDNVKFASGEVPLHVIGLGAWEAYGFNRNGDGFKEAACKAYHDTFVKHGHWYRNHKNKDPKKSYGVIKASAYNDRMRRVELLIGLNGTKEAAERNGGLVADEELEKLASGSDIPVSMACVVDHDVCSCCNNRARTRDEYCTGEKCAAGGCRDNLTRLYKQAGDIHHLGVFNPHPRWFDMSKVWRQADRICLGNRADWMKSASDDGFLGVGGARTADELGVTAPAVLLRSVMPEVGDVGVLSQVKLAHAMAALPADCFHPKLRLAFGSAVQPDVDLAFLGLDGHAKTASALAALADNKIVLSVRDFARMTKRAELAADAAGALRGVYARMIDDGSLESRVRRNPYDPAEKTASAAQRIAALRLSPGHSLDAASVDNRVTLSLVRGKEGSDWNSTIPNEKRAHDNREVEELARDYAVYKLAALTRIARFDAHFPLTVKLAACQNESI